VTVFLPIPLVVGPGRKEVGPAVVNVGKSGVCRSRC
jgi:hypothetical protein